MRPNPAYVGQPKEFWAAVRTISQKVGYARRGVFVLPSPTTVETAYRELGLDPEDLVQNRAFTTYGEHVAQYFTYRAAVLTDEVQHLLMNAEEARLLYEKTRRSYPPTGAPQPFNKQKGAKKAPAYLTCMVNLIIEANIRGWPCDYDPRVLTAITMDARPLRTLARRVDGAFPSATNPVALWEIKEYYYTTTFGSRIADGVYETLLDGMELEELREHTGINVLHYLMVDAKDTWWEDGKSYLCRMIDMIHMGYVDEVLFGREVVDRLPDLAASWVELIPEAEDRQSGAERYL
jgi:hypothetical protein